MAGMGTKNAMDAMSRKSTAFSNNSEMGTPGKFIKNEMTKKQSSLRGSKSSSRKMERQNS